MKVTELDPTIVEIKLDLEAPVDNGIEVFINVMLDDGVKPEIEL